jgi:CelD/BcsL family acetyltransferase involved in cellulose biosynthesis
VIEQISNIDSVEEEWAALAERAEPSPFLHPGWFLAWWRAFGAGRLELLALRRDGELAAILPLRRSRGALRSPTNWDSDVFGAVAADEAARRELLAGLFALRPRYLDFSFLEADRPEPAELAVAAGRYALNRRTILESPYLDHSRFEGWDAYWEGLSGKHRGNVRRARRKLEELGQVEFELLDDPGERLDELLAAGFAIESSGWKGERGTAIDSAAESRAFYEDAAAWAAGRGILRIGFLRVDGRPVAFHFGLEAAGVQYLLKLGVEAELAKVGLGWIVLAEMVEHGFAAGLARTEFMGAADPYKTRWANDTRTLLRVQAFAPGPFGTASRLVQTKGRTLAKRVLRR